RTKYTYVIHCAHRLHSLPRLVPYTTLFRSPMSPSLISFSRLPRRATPFPYTTLFRSPMSASRITFSKLCRRGSSSGVFGAMAPNTSPTAAKENGCGTFAADGDVFGAMAPRSEEHTSELQSPYDLVCRLLLEKKNEIRY